MFYFHGNWTAATSKRPTHTHPLFRKTDTLNLKNIIRAHTRYTIKTKNWKKLIFANSPYIFLVQELGVHKRYTIKKLIENKNDFCNFSLHILLPRWDVHTKYTILTKYDFANSPYIFFFHDDGGTLQWIDGSGEEANSPRRAWSFCRGV